MASKRKRPTWQEIMEEYWGTPESLEAELYS